MTLFRTVFRLKGVFSQNSVQFFREEEAIKLDGLSVAQMKELRDKAEKHTFQAEVNRMMKLIINSLYRNKEVRPENLTDYSPNPKDKSFSARSSRYGYSCLTGRGG